MDGFDDFFKQQGAAPAATPVDKPASEFDDFFQFQREQQQQRATDALNGAIGAKPDQVGKAMTVAPQVGLPSQAVETDIPSFEDQLQMTRAVKRVEANPVLARWLAGDADRARVAIDDFDNLDMVSQAFQALGTGWEEGILTNARARAQFEQSTVGTDRRAELSAYDKRMARNPSLRGLYGTLQAGAGFAGGILDSIVRASDEAVFGAGVGAIAGGAATAPAGGVGAVPGAITGFGVGMTQGFFVDQALVWGGLTYQSLENAVDDGGRPVDPVAKHTAAAAVTLAGYALNYVGGEVIWGSAKKALMAVAVEAVKKPTVARALTSFGKELAKGGVEGAALMGAAAAMQVFAENFAKQYSSDDFATIFNNSEARVQAADQLVQAMTMGAVFMPFVKLPFEIKSLAHDMTRVQQAKNDAAIMQALGEAIGASKVRTRNMDAFQAFAAEHLKGGPIEEVGVPVEAVVELYQSLKIEPGADDGVLGPVAKDIAKQIEQAKETGGDIRLNLDAYTAKLAGSEIWNALSGEIRFRPEGMTLREADHYAKMRGQLLEDSAVEFNKAMDAAAKSEEGAAAVYEDVFSKLRRAGYTVDAATQVATLWASRYRARAERLGDTDALELYDNENITIRRELPPTVRRVGVDRTDMLIEAIRRGEKLPSDRRIYGPTLIEQIKKMGGVFDYGGELKSRDLNKVRGFVRSAKKGGDKEVYGMDGVTRALWEMGYFPEHQERPEVNDLLAAIDEELAGNKRYQYGTDREAEALFKRAVEELDDFLGQNDIDVKKTSNAKIKKLLAAKDAEAKVGTVYEQNTVDTSAAAFKKWFKQSKVVDADGNPQRVYHGTNAKFSKFSTKKGAQGLIWFTSDKEKISRGESGAAGTDRIIEMYVRIENPAGWAEYDKLTLNELEARGYDGVILKDADGSFDGFAFEPKQFKDVRNKGSWSEEDARLLYQSGRNPGATKTVLEPLKDGETREAAFERIKAKHPDAKLIPATGDEPGGVQYVRAKVRITDLPKSEQPNAWREFNQEGEKKRIGAMKLLNDGKIDMDTAAVLQRKQIVENLKTIIERVKRKGDAAKLHKFTARLQHAEAALKAEIKRTGKIPGNPESYLQEGRRGSIRLEDGRSIITLFADLPKSEQPGAWREFNKSGVDVAKALAEKYDDKTIGTTTFRTAFDERTGTVALQHVERVGGTKGQGADALKSFLAEADAGGVTVRLSVEKDGAAKLVPYYKALGFTNRLRNGTDQIMVRKPSLQQEGRRGSIRLEDGRSIITLFKDSDLSTILHEGGHQWLEEFRRDYLDVLSRAPDAAGEMGGHEQLKADFETVMKWLGMESPGEITVEQHEKFARGFEAYFYEGKAPTAALARAFRAFKQWLVRIYRDIAGLNVSMSDDVRGVFDRMLATDDELAAAKESLGANPAFATAKDAGMTDAEFAGYTAQLEKAQQKADETLLGKTMAAVRAKREKEWKTQFKEMRDEVATVIKSRRDLRAEHWLRTGKMLDGATPEGLEHVRLSQQYLADMYGHKGMIELLPERVTAPKDGAHPDMVATLFGYRNGDELVHDLISLEGMRKAEAAVTGKGMGGDRYVSHLIERETTERMLDRHGDALNDGSIEQEAIDALHNQARIEVLGTELRAIGKRAGKMPVDLADMSEWVDGQISDMPIARAKSETGFLRSEGQAGKETQRALLKGDVRAAFVHKQRQIVNALFVKAARAAGDDYASAMKMFQRYAKKAEHKSLDAGYVDQIHALLKRIGFQVKRQDAELAAGIKGQTLRDFVQAKRDAGIDIIASDFVLDGNLDKPVADMTMNELRDVKDAMTSLIHNAREEKLIRLEGKATEREELREAAKAQLDKLPSRKDPAITKGGAAIRSPEEGTTAFDRARATVFRFKTNMRDYASMLWKIERLADLLDGDDPNGFFNQHIVKPVAAREAWAHDKSAAVLDAWLSLVDSMGPEWRKGLSAGRVVLPELRRKSDGRPWEMDRGQLIVLAHNMGSESNLNKMLAGELWDEASVKAVLDRHLTEQDWIYVSKSLEIIGSMRDEIDAQERRSTGIGIKQVEPRDIATKFGVIKGGYFPMLYDPQLDVGVSERAAAGGDVMFDKNYRRAITPHGHTKARVEGYSAPLDFSFGRIAASLDEVIHDLAFRETLIAVDKLVSDKEIRAGIIDKIGRENYQQLKPWLQHIANEKARDNRGLGAGERFIRRVRINATVVGMGLRISTGLQQFAGFANAAEMLGAKYTAKGMKEAFGVKSPLEAASGAARVIGKTKAGKALGFKYLAQGIDAIANDPRKFEEARDFVMERSGEMRHRWNTIDRDLRTLAADIKQKRGIKADIQRFAFHHIAMADQVVAIPTWLGGYRKALDNGATEEQAIFYADKVVRLTQGSGSAKDLAAVQRPGSEIWKLTTMYYTYMSAYINRQASIVTLARKGIAKAKAGDYAGARKDVAASLAKATWLMAISILGADLLAGRGPEEGEDYADWILRRVTFSAFGGVPLVRDIAGIVERRSAGLSTGDFRLSPAERAVDSSLKSGKDFLALFTDDDVSEKWLKNAMETGGYFTGLPGGQAGVSSQYVLDFMQGDEDPDGSAQFFRDLTLGPKPKEK